MTRNGIYDQNWDNINDETQDKLENDNKDDEKPN